MNYLSDAIYENELVELESSFLEHSVTWTAALIFGDKVSPEGRSWIADALREQLRTIGGELGPLLAKENDPSKIKVLIDKSASAAFLRALITLSDPLSIPASITEPHSSIPRSEHLAMLADRCRDFMTENIISYSLLLARHQDSVPPSMAVNLMRGHIRTLLSDVRERKWNVLLQIDLMQWFEPSAVSFAWASVEALITLVHRDMELKIWSGELGDAAGMQRSLTGDFSSFFRSLRKARGWTQEYVAEKVEVSVRTISAWESGASTPRGEQLINLADLFERPVEELTAHLPTG